MDRPHRPLAAVVLALTTLAPGCRSTRPEVPPARPYTSDGRQRKPIDFSSESHPLSGAATAVMQPNMTPGNRMGSPSMGRSRDESATPFGAMPGPSYGGPGTSGLGEPPSPLPAPGPLSAPTEEPTAAPAAASPAPPTLDLPAPTLDLPAPSVTVGGETSRAGVMGRATDLPSPN